MVEITIYTDGASRGNPGPGGYGVILISGKHRKEISGGFKLTTNNRMELMAIIAAFEALKIDGCKVTVYSDSQYVVNAIEKNWLNNWVNKRFKDKKNQDLWLRYLQVSKNHFVKFVWVKGHADNPLNERCDQLAVAASLLPNLPEDVGYEPDI